MRSHLARALSVLCVFVVACGPGAPPSGTSSSAGGGASTPAAPAPAATTAPAAAAPAVSSGDTLAAIKQRGVINLYMEAQFEPYESVDSGGNIVGLDVDLANKMFKDDLGVTPKFTDVDYPGLLPSLIDGKSDLLISALGSTKERMRQFDFSIPYSPTTTVAVARADDTSIGTTDDLNGKVMAAQTGTPPLTSAQTFSDSLKAKGGQGFSDLKDYPHYPDELQDLTAKRVDAAAMSLSSISLIIHQRPGLYKVVGPIGPINYFETVFRKGDTALQEYVNSELRKLKADGTLTALHTKWFGDSFPIDVATLPDPWEPLQ
jgi:polar amino acid transport system substrate-binding protein